jgi:hypothetical protein
MILLAATIASLSHVEPQHYVFGSLQNSESDCSFLKEFVIENFL